MPSETPMEETILQRVFDSIQNIDGKVGLLTLSVENMDNRLKAVEICNEKKNEEEVKELKVKLSVYEQESKAKTYERSKIVLTTVIGLLCTVLAGTMMYILAMKH